MARVARRVNGFLAAYIPEKRLFLQTGNGTSYVRLTSLTQLVLGAFGLVVVGWTALASAVVVLDVIAANPAPASTAVIHDAYQSRLDELAAERDSRAAEANSAQLRFQVAMEQIGRQQSAILASVEERRELAAALDLMRGRLSEALVERGDAEADREDLDATLAARSGTVGDLSDTLETVSGALSVAVEERDSAAAERERLARDLADMELRMTVASRRQDQMVEQLEQAVALSLGPLEGMLKSTDLDVDGLIDTVRRSHSGMGGPLGPVSLSTRSIDDPKVSRRFTDAMQALDRVTLMRLAVDQVPLAMPVRSGFRLTSGFGMRRNPTGRGHRMHEGLDLAAPSGTPIYATADGVVIDAHRESGYGNVVRIRHASGTETVYAHLSRIRVKPGQRLSLGEQIGAMGSTGRSTGTHLHYEVRVNGKPVNPMQFLEASKDVLETPDKRTAAAD